VKTSTVFFPGASGVASPSHIIVSSVRPVRGWLVGRAGRARGPAGSGTLSCVMLAMLKPPSKLRAPNRELAPNIREPTDPCLKRFWSSWMTT
jgi:hypothetical protein